MDRDRDAPPVWALCRVTPGGSVPLLAVDRASDDADIAVLVEELGRHELPPDLEVVRLDDADADFVASQWEAVRL